MPVRLMAGLLYLKHAYDLSDEDVCVRWLENLGALPGPRLLRW